MSYLEVPGAGLYYESVGKGPMLLCISGADGSCEIWRRLAEYLKDHFTVVMWDRRGFSRRVLNGAQDYENRLETDADDAERLIAHLSPNELATVIGNSSGAIVSLSLLARHPSILRTLVCYEPPAAALLPDFDNLWAQHEEIYATYRAAGIPPAMEKFATLTQTEARVLKAMADPRSGPYTASNSQYWFEREFMYYPKTHFNVEGQLQPSRGKLMLVNGELSKKEPYQYRANVRLAETLDLHVVHLAGEHVGHATHAEEFGRGLLEALRKRDEFYNRV